MSTEKDVTNKVVRLRKVPEPVMVNNRALLLGGWNTLAVCDTIREKSYHGQWTKISDIAVFVFHKDIDVYRARARKRVRDIRREFAKTDEYLLVLHDQRRRTYALKVCDRTNNEDRKKADAALEQQFIKGEIEKEENLHWRKILRLESKSD